MISKKQYQKYKQALNLEKEFMHKLAKNWLSKEEQEQRTNYCGIELTNDIRSSVEVYEFVTIPPEKYTLYIDEENYIAMTFTGEKLGDVSFGNEFKSNLGDRRIPVLISGINNKRYHGIFYKTAGQYAHIKIFK